MSNHDAAYWREYRRTNARYIAKRQTLEWKMADSVRKQRYRNKHPDVGKAHYRDNIEYYKEKSKRWRIAENFRCALDADFAELRRERQRIYNRKHNDKTRKIPYRAKPSMRIPAYVPFGVNPIDTHSPFLRNNMDLNAILSCDNFAMMLACERRKRGRG